MKERKVRTRWLILANEFLMSPAHPPPTPLLNFVCFILTCLGKQSDENLQHLWLYLQPLTIKTWKLLVTKVNLLFFFLYFPAVLSFFPLALTLYTLTLVSTFSILFSTHSLWYWQGEFVKQSKLHWLAIISLILMILVNYSAVLLSGDIRCWHSQNPPNLLLFLSLFHTSHAIILLATTS